MLHVESAHVVFDRGTSAEVHALRGVSLDLPAGTFVTVVGSNGAGKSTLTNVIAGNVPLTSGTVHIDGRNVTRQPAYRRARHVACVFADPLAGTVGDMSIEDNLAMALGRGQRRTLRAARTRRTRARIEQLLSELGLNLEHRLQDDVQSLSSGQRQSLTLAMACANPPDILLLDEHLSGLDPITRERLIGLTVRAAGVAGCVTVMVTHSMADAVRLGSHLLVMNAGQVVAQFEGDDKSALTVDSLVRRIGRSGLELPDRSLLGTGDVPRT